MSNSIAFQSDCNDFYLLRAFDHDMAFTKIRCIWSMAAMLVLWKDHDIIFCEKCTTAPINVQGSFCNDQNSELPSAALEILCPCSHSSLQLAHSNNNLQSST